jgi:DNA-binding CsgD family transcriptional regulator
MQRTLTRNENALTDREREVLGYVSQGFTSQQTADMLFVSKRTVDFHLANGYRKLGVHNRIQAYHAVTGAYELRTPAHAN